VPQTSGATNILESSTDFNFSQKLDTTFQPTSDIYIDGSWLRTVNKRISTSRPTKTVDVTFPDLSLNLEGLEKSRLLSKWARTSSINSSYRRTIRRTGDLPRASDPPVTEDRWYDTETVQNEFSPFLAWTVNWQSGLNTTISHNRSSSVDDSEFNDQLTTNQTNTTSYRFTARYSFSAPQGISLLGKRLRFRSDLTLNFDVDRSETKTTTKITRAGTVISDNLGSHRKTLSIKPRATYNFSRTIQGSLDISYARNNDLKSGRKETVITVALEALIKF
jgi:cell surface protein SprA